MRPVPKKLYFIASAQKDLRQFPEEVRDTVGLALRQAQLGGRHEDAKPLRGVKSAGVLEIVGDYHGDTYRAVYTIRFPDAIYVLHAFLKKSKKGVATARPDIELVRKRLRLAERHYHSARLAEEE